MLLDEKEQLPVPLTTTEPKKRGSAIFKRILLFLSTVFVVNWLLRARFGGCRNKHNHKIVDSPNQNYEEHPYLIYRPSKHLSKHGEHFKAVKHSRHGRQQMKHQDLDKPVKQRLVNYFRYSKRQQAPISIKNSYDPANYTRLMVYTQLDIPVNIRFGYALDDTQTIQFDTDITQSSDVNNQVSAVFTPNDRQGVTLYINPTSGTNKLGYSDSGASANVIITLPKNLEVLTTLLVYVVNGQMNMENVLQGNGIESFNFQSQTAILNLNGLNATSTTIATESSNITGVFTVRSSLTLSNVAGNTDVYVQFTNTSNSNVSAKSQSGTVKLSMLSSTFSGDYKVQSISGDTSVIDSSGSSKLVVTDDSTTFKSGSFNSPSSVPGLLSGSINIENNVGSSELAFL